MSDDLAPGYSLYVAGRELKADVTQFVRSVEYESSDNMIDMAKVTLSNPDFLLSASKVFAPGNEMDIYFGYGAKLPFVARVVLMAPKVRFPLDGMPVLEITGYTRDYFMRETRPDPEAQKKRKRLETMQAAATGKRKKRLSTMLKRLKAPTVWQNATVREVVESRAQSYGFKTEVDDAPWPEGGIVHPQEMSDHEFLQRLANMTGFLFWVEYDNLAKSWYLNFRDPLKFEHFDQDKVYSFKYGVGEKSTLLSFEPEMAFQDHYVEVRTQSKFYSFKKIPPTPPKAYVPGWQGFVLETGSWPQGTTKKITRTEEVTIYEESELTADPQYTGQIEELEAALESAEALKVFIGDYSFAVKPGVTFKNPAAMELWLAHWYRRMRENFIMGNGRLEGLETLMARQVHSLSGMGPPYDGRYYFSRVRHMFQEGSGYKCEFSGRKVLE